MAAVIDVAAAAYALLASGTCYSVRFASKIALDVGTLTVLGQ